MKLALFSILLITLVGCEKVTFMPENLDKGKGICKTNGGVGNWQLRARSKDIINPLFVKVTCKNAVTYSYKVER